MPRACEDVAGESNVVDSDGRLCGSGITGSELSQSIAAPAQDSTDGEDRTHVVATSRKIDDVSFDAVPSPER
jgi:hypothetical protein